MCRYQMAILALGANEGLPEQEALAFRMPHTLNSV